MNPEWQHITSDDTPEKLGQTSQDIPVVIFKHSTRCSVSAMALRSFERDWQQPAAPVKLYMLNVINQRPVSQAAAAHWGVRHESPQVLIVYKDKVIYNASHSSIDADAILEHLKDVA